MIWRGGRLEYHEESKLSIKNQIAVKTKTIKLLGKRVSDKQEKYDINKNKHKTNLTKLITCIRNKIQPNGGLLVKDNQEHSRCP